MIRAIDLCCGAGGWAVAARGLPISIELAIDWWQPACMTYALNHPETRVIQADLTRPPFDPEALAGRFDLVLGGIPCQWISQYRQFAHGPCGDEERERERGLLDSILAIARTIEPRWWCLEDVVKLIRELPPLTPYQVLDSRHWSAQRRKRVYVGEFPAPRPRHGRRVLGDHLRPGPHRVGTRLYGRTPQRSRTFTRTTTMGAWADQVAPTVCNTGGRRDSELGLVDDRLPGGLRQFDWRELASLQGYPDDYLFYGAQTALDQMIANSVQIDTSRAILEAIVREAVSEPTMERADHGQTQVEAGEAVEA